MARYTTTIESDLPVREAFHYLADFASAEEWDPGVVSATRLDGPGPRLGSRYNVVSRFRGKEVPMVYEIVDVAPDSKVVLRAETDKVVSVDTITFAPQGEGSRVTYDANLRLKGVLGRIGDPILQIMFKSLGDKAQAGLRRELRVAARTAAS